MGCGSAKISLTHRRGAGKRRDGDTSDDSDSEGEESASATATGSRHQLRGSHKVRPAALVTSTSVDSQLKSTTSKRPKIVTSFSQNDFSTTTSISGTARIRVTLSHDGSLLEVETETFETLEEHDGDDDDDATDNIDDDDDDDDDPDAIRAFDDRHRDRKCNPGRTRRRGRKEAALSSSAAVFPSCSGTQQPSSSRPDARRLYSGGGAGGGGGDSSSGSSSRACGGSLTSVRRLPAPSQCDTEDEEDYDDSTEVTAFIAVAEIEEEPQAVKARATRSKSINSILSQAEENHLQELEQKPKRICKECGCCRNSGSREESRTSVDGSESNPTVKDKKKAAKPHTAGFVKHNPKSLERTSSATESSDGDIQKDISRKSSRSGGSTPYKTASQQKKKSDKKKQLPDGASPLAIEKHAECCCYCHQKRRGKSKSRAPTDGDTDSSTSVVASAQTPRANNHSAPSGQRLGNSTSKNSLSDSPSKRNMPPVAKSAGLNPTPVEQVKLLPDPAVSKKTAWSKQNSTDKLAQKYMAAAASINDEGKNKKDFLRENMCDSKRSVFTSNDSIVTVPVAPIVDPNAVFNFDDHEWAELALMNGNPSAKSPNKSAQLSSTTKSKSKEPKKQGKSNSKESRTKRASKLLMSSRSSSFAGNSSSSKSSGKSSSDLPKIPSGLRSAGSSGCVTDIDDGDVTDHSTTTTMTSSSSIGDVTSMAITGICDTLDHTCLQVHTDFFNDFCDFFDDEDVGVD